MCTSVPLIRHIHTYVEVKLINHQVYRGKKKKIKFQDQREDKKVETFSQNSVRSVSEWTCGGDRLDFYCRWQEP